MAAEEVGESCQHEAPLVTRSGSGSPNASCRLNLFAMSGPLRSSGETRCLAHSPPPVVTM